MFSARAVALRRVLLGRACSNKAPSLGIRLLPLDGTRASLDAALAVVRDARPKQVMLETCDQRRRLCQQRAEAADATQEQQSGSQGVVLSHADAIASIHGGLRSDELMALEAAAKEVGAQVYPVDRPYQETQNSVARRLFLNPREMLAFARYAPAHLSRSTAAPEHACPRAVAEILGPERERFIAAEASRRAVRGAEAVLVCSDARQAGLQQLLQDSASRSTRPDGKSATKIWPFLLILVYVVVPGYGSIFVFWRVARGLANAISSFASGGNVAEAPAEEPLR
eukprot:TRINITY_DN29382_c0_g1_i2.p1 TRINITY_DN29382_c0_g1~~TRINITY_DN29382_c0_g1_i2.p1  ORF type:complete len:292 (+),score=57.69 TRINITY_DN29382_c0_g1_i2:28-876(+)